MYRLYSRLTRWHTKVLKNNIGNTRSGRPFLRTIGAIIDMKEGNIRFQFPLRKGMEHFPRNKVKLPYESIMRATYELSAKDGTT